MSADPQGVNKSQERYKFILRTLTFMRNGEDILLLKGAPTKRLYANKYNGVGGHVEKGEAIPASALREIHEEVGITDIYNLRLHAVISIDTDLDSGIILFVFTVYTETRSFSESSEGIPEWFNRDNLPENQIQCRHSRHF